MNVLILHAHPESKSFSSALKDVAQTHFESLGHQVDVRDLYAMNFNPIVNKSDFNSLNNPEYFDVMKEQMFAFQQNALVEDIQAEMLALEKADFIILNFPVWWSSFPAILKGWFDRVFVFGFAYHPKLKRYETGAFLGKKVMCCICVGAAAEAFLPGGEHLPLETILAPIHHQVLSYTGMTVLPQFSVHRPHLSNHETLKGYLNKYKEYLENIENVDPIYQPEAIIKNN